MLIKFILLFILIMTKINIDEKVTSDVVIPKATLIQLSTDEKLVRSMGYILVTENGKVIVIDSGNYSDGRKLEKYINKYGGRVDSWYITHFHADHTGAFRYIVNETNIEIGRVYQSLCSRENVERYERIRLKDYDEYVSALDSEKLKRKSN